MATIRSVRASGVIPARPRQNAAKNLICLANDAGGPAVTGPPYRPIRLAAGGAWTPPPGWQGLALTPTHSPKPPCICNSHANHPDGVRNLPSSDERRLLPRMRSGGGRLWIRWSGRPLTSHRKPPLVQSVRPVARGERNGEGAVTRPLMPTESEMNC